jgi:hypothetical protein
MRANGVDWDLTDDDDQLQIGLPDEQITTWVDVHEFGHRKYLALAADASQPDNANFLTLGLESFTELLGVETFVRVHSELIGLRARETDLFAGLR